MIKEISAKTESTINVDDDGNVVVASPDEELSNAAIELINAIVQEAEVGKLYNGKVRKIMDFGAFVEILPELTG
jgi:polyribonucleotide nucleotidyltransferase